MNYFKLFTYFMAGLALVLSSCSMQKRVYSKGYTIHWKKKQHSTRAHEQLARSSEAAPQQPAEATLPAMAAQTRLTEEAPAFENQPEAAAQAPRKAAPAQPALHKKTSLAAAEKNRESGFSLFAKEQKHMQKQAKGKRSGEGGKSQIVALVLCIFLGLLGIHRFYLGYTGMGLLYLFTAGILGIGWVIDIILLIIPNGLTPKNKTSYDE